MKTMHLFAGAGGGLLGDLILGHEPIIAVEWDRYACQVLRERAKDGWFPKLSVWEGDVRLFDPSEYSRKVDCIHAGFPCQDISTAGNQAGVGEGTRSGLYREVLRISDVVRPKYLFLENVAAIVTGNNGEWLRTIIADLAARGYVCKWRCLSAAEVGACHRRDRWWLLAYSDCIRPIHSEPKEQSAEIRQYAQCDIGASSEDVADTTSLGQSGQGESGKRSSETEEGEGKADKSEPECFGSFWSIEPKLDRVVNGLANRMDRLKAIGNGQVPIQAAVAWKLLGGE